MWDNINTHYVYQLKYRIDIKPCAEYSVVTLERLRWFTSFNKWTVYEG